MNKTYIKVITFLGLFALLFSAAAIRDIKIRNQAEIKLQDENEKLRYEVEVLQAHVNLQDSIIADEKLKNTNLWDFIRSTEDYQWLLKMTESEGSDEPLGCKMLIASIVPNRVNCDGLGSTVKEVIFRPGQFDVVEFGMIYNAVPSEETIEAVEFVIENGPVTDAIYFMNPDLSDTRSKNWMRTLEFVAKSGNTEFYKD